MTAAGAPRGFSVIASAAKQSSAAPARCGALDCFVAALLAMTAAGAPHGSPSLRAQRSNPVRRGRHAQGLDCFVAALLAMTGGGRPSRLLRHCERSEAI